MVNCTIEVFAFIAGATIKARTVFTVYLPLVCISYLNGLSKLTKSRLARIHSTRMFAEKFTAFAAINIDAVFCTTIHFLG